ncbi:MAG TPA: S8 family serine peptidase, partial [Thermoanaerobaculia bacterium]
MGRLIRVASLLCSILAAAASAESLPRLQTIASDGTETTDQIRIERRSIVELAAPRVASSGQRAARAAMLAQFRGDLARLTSIPASRIRHEYSAVFFGAAIDAPPEALASLRALGYVRAIHRDRTVRAYQSDAPIDARPRVNAQSFTGGGSGTVVAILDTGIDYTQPALGDGYGPSFKVIGGHDFVNDDADGMDDQGHGTHVAGIVAANGGGLVGVAPE